MKKSINCLNSIFIIILFLSLIGCGKESEINDNKEVYTKEYYVIEDFHSILIGNSSFKDVYEIAPSSSIQVTSFGGFCEYPTENGGCIRIKFQGDDLIVIDIEEVDNSAN